MPGKNGCHLYDVPQEGRWNNACIMFCRKVGWCMGRMAVICMMFHWKEGGIMPV